MFADMYDPGTPIEFLPIWFGQVVRVLSLCLAAMVAGKILFGLIDKGSRLRNLTFDRRVALTCVLIFTVQAVVRMIQRFDERVTIEGLPFTFMALVCAWYALYRVHGRVN